MLSRGCRPSDRTGGGPALIVQIAWKWKDIRRRFTDRDGRWKPLSTDGIDLFAGFGRRHPLPMPRQHDPNPWPLKVDGGMTASLLLMQFPADVLVRPHGRRNHVPQGGVRGGVRCEFRPDAATRSKWRAGRTWTPEISPDAPETGQRQRR
jgi:hypothetical protein